MTVTSGPNLGLLVDAAPRDQYYNEYTRFLRGIDGLMQCRVKDKDLTAPPGAPVNGDMYIPATGATGPWAGQDQKLARYFDVGVGAPGWEFYTPKAGWRTYVDDEAATYEYSGSAWIYLIGRGVIAASATSLINQPIAGGGSVPVALEVEEFDYGGIYDPVTSRFTPTVPGLYQYQISVGFITGTAFPPGERLVVQLNKNGVAYDVFNTSTYDAARNIARTIAFVDANGTDYFEMRARHDSGLADVNIEGAILTRMQMIRIGGI